MNRNDILAGSVCPIVLYPERVNDINEYLMSRTGCFAFLYDTFWDRIGYRSKTYDWEKTVKGVGKVQFEALITGLYVLYHDCGSVFLKNILMDAKNNMVSNGAGINNIWTKRVDDANKHIKQVDEVFRACVVHSNEDQTIYRDMDKELTTLYLYNKSRKERSKIHGYISSDVFDTDMWNCVNDMIRVHSNNMVELLLDWADYRSANMVGSIDDYKHWFSDRTLKSGEGLARLIKQDLINGYTNLSSQNYDLNDLYEKTRMAFDPKAPNGGIISTPKDIITFLQNEMSKLNNRQNSSKAMAAANGFGIPTI